MTDVVLITAFQRPEFLWLCLEQIVNADGYNENHYIINLDHNYRRLNLDVITKFRKHFNSLEVNKTPYIDYLSPASKQSYAVLEGYRLAQSKSDDLVYMIEEDVMISTAFFDWHKRIHKIEKDIYCSIATRNNNTRVPPINNPEAYYLIRGDYQSLGVCFKKDMLNIVLAHAGLEYYKNPWAYCQAKWPNSPINGIYVEQDGLHRRAMGQHPVAFSYDGFAFHAGFYGYNRKSGSRVTGTISEKVEKIRKIAFNDAALKQLVEQGQYDINYYLDSVPVPLKSNWSGKLDQIQPH